MRGPCLQLHARVRLGDAHYSLQLAHRDWNHWRVALVLPGRRAALRLAHRILIAVKPLT